MLKKGSERFEVDSAHFRESLTYLNGAFQADPELRSRMSETSLTASKTLVFLAETLLRGGKVVSIGAASPPPDAAAAGAASSSPSESSPSAPPPAAAAQQRPPSVSLLSVIKGGGALGKCSALSFRQMGGGSAPPQPVKSEAAPPAAAAAQPPAPAAAAAAAAAGAGAPPPPLPAQSPAAAFLALAANPFAAAAAPAANPFTAAAALAPNPFIATAAPARNPFAALPSLAPPASALASPFGASSAPSSVWGAAGSAGAPASPFAPTATALTSFSAVNGPAAAAGGFGSPPNPFSFGASAASSGGGFGAWGSAPSAFASPSSAKAIAPVEHAHPLTRMKGKGRECDLCGQSSAKVFFRCLPCNYDECVDCRTLVAAAALSASATAAAAPAPPPVSAAAVAVRSEHVLDADGSLLLEALDLFAPVLAQEEASVRAKDASVRGLSLEEKTWRVAAVRALVAVVCERVAARSAAVLAQVQIFFARAMDNEFGDALRSTLIEAMCSPVTEPAALTASIPAPKLPPPLTGIARTAGLIKFLHAGPPTTSAASTDTAASKSPVFGTSSAFAFAPSKPSAAVFGTAPLPTAAPAVFGGAFGSAAFSLSAAPPAAAFGAFGAFGGGVLQAAAAAGTVGGPLAARNPFASVPAAAVLPTPAAAPAGVGGGASSNPFSSFSWGATSTPFGAPPVSAWGATATPFAAAAGGAGGGAAKPNNPFGIAWGSATVTTATSDATPTIQGARRCGFNPSDDSSRLSSSHSF